MAIAKITIWLKDLRRDYNYGLLLYDQFGTSELLKVFFKHGNSNYHQDRLYNALEELNPTLEELTNKSEFKIPSLQEMPVPVKKYGVPDDQWDKLPDSIKDLYVMSSKLHRHSQLLFDQARIATSDEARAELGVQILNERSKLNSNWKDIKDYHEQGKLKDVLVEEKKASIQDLPIAKLIRLKANIPSSLCKDRKQVLTMPDGPKKNKVLLRIQSNEAQLELVKKRLEEM